MSLTRFASTDELDTAALAAAPLRSIPRPSTLSQPLEITSRRAARAAASIGLETVGDLIEHLPFRHENRETRPISSLAVGEDATVSAQVLRVTSRHARNRRLAIVEATVADETSAMKAVWFGQQWIADRLTPGMQLTLTGRFEGRGGFKVRDHDLRGAAATVDNGLVGIYPTTDGLSAKQLRVLVHASREGIYDVVEPLPAWLRAAERLPERAAALMGVHFPETPDDEAAGRERLAFEELLLIELALAARKHARQLAGRAVALEPTGELVEPWIAGLPFALTSDQRAACAEIDSELSRNRPMQRLLMGEVGSGKTVVALHAMLRAVEAGHQAALMAPTETLAEQHLITLDRLLGGQLPIELLTGSTPAARRRDTLGRLASGELGLVVGTHALIEPAVELRSLAVVVVDEQHRFGVRQRAALEAKGPAGLAPHTLHMTATPIPRTLQLTEWGDVDVTTLRELPAGRAPIETEVAATETDRARAYIKAREAIAAGRQVFVVCPLVEESESLQAKAATTEFDRLRRTEFREQRVALIHGQLPARAKAAAMRAFADGEADVLVATSVIEVGIDVPNATVMLIEAAERYGISQLHQLRGRIGRGHHRSTCILFGDPNLPRIRALARERDGFRLAEIDLELRGYGEVLGTRQHGLSETRFAQLPADAPLLLRARRRADQLLARDPRIDAPEHALLRDAAEMGSGPEIEPIPA
jgi:ATP-dependent DNA helicase RecG